MVRSLKIACLRWCVPWVLVGTSSTLLGCGKVDDGESDDAEPTFPGVGGSASPGQSSGAGASSSGGAGAVGDIPEGWIQFRCGNELGWGPDEDGDGWADSSRSLDFPIELIDCLKMEGDEFFGQYNLPDCDDTNPEAHRLAFGDEDGDGEGNLELPHCAEKKELEWVYGHTDCDDTNFDLRHLYPEDADGDGYGSEKMGCGGIKPPEGYVLNRPDRLIDCDDSDADIFPGGVDYPHDDVDGNCDGLPGVDVDALHEMARDDLEDRNELASTDCQGEGDLYVIAAGGYPQCFFYDALEPWVVEVGNRGEAESKAATLIVSGLEQEWRFAIPPIPANEAYDLISLGPLPVEVTFRFEVVGSHADCNGWEGVFDAFAGCTVP